MGRLKKIIEISCMTLYGVGILTLCGAGLFGGSEVRQQIGEAWTTSISAVDDSTYIDVGRIIRDMMDGKYQDSTYQQIIR